MPAVAEQLTQSVTALHSIPSWEEPSETLLTPLPLHCVRGAGKPRCKPSPRRDALGNGARWVEFTSVQGLHPLTPYWQHRLSVKLERFMMYSPQHLNYDKYITKESAWLGFLGCRSRRDAGRNPVTRVTFSLPRGTCFMHFAIHLAQKQRWEPRRIPFRVEVPRSVLHHTKKEKISSCKSVYFLKFMLP